MFPLKKFDTRRYYNIYKLVKSKKLFEIFWSSKNGNYLFSLTEDILGKIT